MRSVSLVGILLATGTAMMADMIVLPNSQGSVSCTALTSIDDASSCSQSGVGGDDFATLAGLPYIAEEAYAETDAFGLDYQGYIFLRYNFEIVGGNAGDQVPLLIQTNLYAQTTGPGDTGYADASLSVSGSEGSTGVAVCMGPSCPNAAIFSGTISLLMQSGFEGSIQLNTQAEVGFSAGAETAHAGADPFLFIDPGFANASLYSVVISPDLGNGVSSAPEPGTFVLLGAGLGTLACARRRSRT